MVTNVNTKKHKIIKLLAIIYVTLAKFPNGDNRISESADVRK